ncbi:uroporphyrinogen-III C-methyltransferase [Malassezia vespertilionis]|uniref:precorrin-2 dehydrogenase n=1 Tax=Malassezia vespertilionis TaxID=2020962 RepID=A0A2N1JBR6_9BASI|nr:uroporphyrinogen-III C-methyltransferase [Malassezia vespertilionis]PKI83994.1 hypothetical protein MVES_002290 [Malassezia vespertilionis]WFD07066.1 uroporphyrinogen-III C-methyltransferase [Malassezia vespertilionis]
MAAPAALLLAHRPVHRILLIIGAGKLAAARMHLALEASMRPVIVWHGHAADAHADVRDAVEAARAAWHSAPYEAFFPQDTRACEHTWRAMIAALDGAEAAVFAVCITDTLAQDTDEARDVRRACMERCTLLATLCRQLRLPLNVTDQPALCDVSLPAVHRFPCGPSGPSGSDGAPSSLQVAVTTNGRGCRLAGRIRRTIVSSLPPNVGDAVERIGEMREMAKESDAALGEEDESSVRDTLGYSHSHDTASSAAQQRRRMRWVAQISEYWPLERLGRLGRAEMQSLLATQLHDANADADAPQCSAHDLLDASERAPKRSRHELDLRSSVPRGQVYLLGSGPGDPRLLTVAAHQILTSSHTHLILSDKLVPTAVLALIPASTALVIAKKFPGNAEGAQSELISLAMEAVSQGKTVVRLKQGDPYVFGRGGEELVAFRNAGVACTTVPGISSAFAGPLLVDIPVTQRGAADSLVLCTGVGRGGRQTSLLGYERARTLLVLMGVARLRAVVDALSAPHDTAARQGPPFPPYVPIAIVERASSEDQRVIASTLERICDVLENRVPDGQRPPSMMVIGWAVLSLAGTVAGNGVLDDEERCAAEHSTRAAADTALAALDAARVEQWLGPKGYIIHEGLPQGYQNIESYMHSAHDALPPRSTAGWAAPRYGAHNALQGGWTPRERGAS